MLKRYFILVHILLVISLNPAFAAETGAKIKNVCLTGLFKNSFGDQYIKTECMLPVDRKMHKIEFTHGNKAYSIPFIATFIKTTQDEEGNFISDEVKIEYFSLANSGFYQNNAILKIEGYDENGNILPVDEVISYRKADNNLDGWIMDNTIFPVSVVTFTTKNSGNNKGATDRAWFILSFSYLASEQ